MKGELSQTSEKLHQRSEAISTRKNITVAKENVGDKLISAPHAYGEMAEEKVISGSDTMRAGTYFPPQPVTGKHEFDRYINENIQRPDTITSGQRVVVVLVFKVLTNGMLDSIKTVRSPGKQFSDEAIRLLKSGPAWKPAEQDGKIIEEHTRVSIVFR